jgi:hypothetical protein
MRKGTVYQIHPESVADDRSTHISQYRSLDDKNVPCQWKARQGQTAGCVIDSGAASPRASILGGWVRGVGEVVLWTLRQLCYLHFQRATWSSILR